MNFEKQLCGCGHDASTHHNRRDNCLALYCRCSRFGKSSQPTSVTGPELLNSSDPKSLKAVEILMLDLHRQADEARRDPAKFLQLVMRGSERGEVFDTVPPHQRVLIDFVEFHERSAIIMPIGSGKSSTLSALTVWHIGLDPTFRGAIVSASEAQAEKILTTIRETIDSARTDRPILSLIFPKLRPTQRRGEPWTQSNFTVDRPLGQTQPTLSAFGMDSSRVLGSRLNWIWVDDMLNASNTNTPEQRRKVRDWLTTTVFSRLDPKECKAIFTNTPWHPDDALHAAAGLGMHSGAGNGWATLIMDILGDITVHDDAERQHYSLPSWDSDMLRPATNDKNNPACRLVAHDPDPQNEKPLWPEKYSVEFIESKRRGMLPSHFNQLYRSAARADEDAMCKLEYIEACKAKARELHITGFVSEYHGPNPTFTGVDLAFGPDDQHDETALVTIEVRPGGLCVILDVDCGRWDSPRVVDKIHEKWKAYNSIVRVENNGAQRSVIQFARKKNLTIPVRAHTTTAEKAKFWIGVPGIFVEFANGAWAIPNHAGAMHPQMTKLVDQCLNYVPARHTGDALMALYFARAQRMEWGMDNGPDPEGNAGGNIGQTIMSR